MAYSRRLAEIPARELRNGNARAELIPVQQVRRAWIGRAELAARLGRAQADPGLRADLALLAGSTDDLGPIR
jgi:hypothetical protein